MVHLKSPLDLLPMLNRCYHSFLLNSTVKMASGPMCLVMLVLVSVHVFITQAGRALRSVRDKGCFHTSFLFCSVGVKALFQTRVHTSKPQTKCANCQRQLVLQYPHQISHLTWDGNRKMKWNVL